jgi:dipeptidyl aminopeptidase/acylaminoacyl peptidase
MTEAHVTPYGEWKSPIKSDSIAASVIGLGQVQVDGKDIYWVESRPLEAGRNVIVRQSAGGQLQDVNPKPYNVRTRVHEYGGGAYLVVGGECFFSNYADQMLYRIRPGEAPVQVTRTPDMRYADAIADNARQRLIAIREDHTVPGREAVNSIVGINLAMGGTEDVLVQGNTFYASPRISPDGTRLAWLTWNHPNMPWDGCELWVGEFQPDGSIGRATLVAGGPSESIFQPEWSPKGELFFVSDRTDWWNLYRQRNGKVEAVCPQPAEFGVPQWAFGMRTYGFIAADQIASLYTQNGIWYLGKVDPQKGTLTPIETPYTDISGLYVKGDGVVFIGSSPALASAVVSLNLTSEQSEVIRISSDLAIDAGYISEPQPIEFPTENGLTAYAFFYAPKNKDYAAPAQEKPPLLVKTHGGPTAATGAQRNLTIQYWTSRGFAVLDVNYGGSTGYGRAYRQRLNGQWGIIDVDDAVNGARYLVTEGLVDENRLTIDGGSAGGYTTLATLAFRKLFHAGASYYGVSDLEALARDTHKFESRYLDSMIGPYPARRDLYIQRSPVHYVNQIECSMILFQGLEDKVVPPNQSEAIYQAVRDKGLPVAYIPFEGEQHGFRRAENIRRSLDAEFYFYARVFGFRPADDIEPVQIENSRALLK